ncbi:MAG: hypothetical protein RL685_771 [Pseudomonadota bacterium]|jgi:hypothetical protein
MNDLTSQVQNRTGQTARSSTEQVVRFRLRDVYVPSAEELLEELFGDLVLVGKVVVQSSNGNDEPCVAVQLEGSQKLVVISTAHLL